ncbi:MAG: hypothetical protein WC455_14260 [Dehalococcoidia bacterium]|jgi:hypothetical protein
MTEYIVTHTRINPNWTPAPTSLVTKAYRLMLAAQHEFDLFEDACQRGEYGDDYESVAYTQDRDRLGGAYQDAIARYEIVRQGLECGCVMDQHCAICDAVAHVTFVEEE